MMAGLPSMRVPAISGPLGIMGRLLPGSIDDAHGDITPNVHPRPCRQVVPACRARPLGVIPTNNPPHPHTGVGETIQTSDIQS